MMKRNKEEADKCIHLAEQYIQEKDREKAIRFLQEAERLYPQQKAKDLFLQINLMAPSAATEADQLKECQVSEEQEILTKTSEYTPEQVETVKRIKAGEDHYEILGVSKEADDLYLKKAYKKLALQLHPDKNQCPGSAEAFKAIGKAFAILTDADKRKEYDFYLRVKERMARNLHQEYFYTGGFETKMPEDFEWWDGGWQRQTSSTSSYGNSHRDRQRSGYGALLKSLSIILGIYWALSYNLNRSDSTYRFQQSSKYKVHSHLQPRSSLLCEKQFSL